MKILVSIMTIGKTCANGAPVSSVNFEIHHVEFENNTSNFSKQLNNSCLTRQPTRQPKAYPLMNKPRIEYT